MQPQTKGLNFGEMKLLSVARFKALRNGVVANPLIGSAALSEFSNKLLQREHSGRVANPIT